MTKADKKSIKVILICVILFLIMLVGMIYLILRHGLGIINTVDINTDINKYTKYMNFEKKNADQEYYKWGMDESIWPKKITNKMNVKDYKMVRNKGFDTEYMGYMVVKYKDDDYQNEFDRLKKYNSSEYLGEYGVTGQPKGYDLLAIHTNEDKNGFVYALGNNKDEIIYVEIIFCNYFMVADYKKHIPEEYILQSLNVSENNNTRKEFLKEN